MNRTRAEEEQGGSGFVAPTPLVGVVPGFLPAAARTGIPPHKQGGGDDERQDGSPPIYLERSSRPLDSRTARRKKSRSAVPSISKSPRTKMS
jgi:hypothetical protein